MTKQELARKRNWNKRHIAGLLANLQRLQYSSGECTLTLEERDFLNKAQLQIDLLMIKWDRNSKVLGLKPRNKSKIDNEQN